MKKLKYSVLIWALFVCFGLTANAQTDSRQRTVETVITDNLAQLPVSSSKEYNEVIGEMAATGQKGMEMLASMLKPADKAKNATFEYAINSIVNYVNVAGKENLQDGIRKGLINGLEKCTDNANRAFLLTELNKLATASEYSLYEKLLGDAYLQDYAIRGLAQIPGINSQVVELLKSQKAPKSALAYLAYERNLKGVEPILLEWAKESDEKTLDAVYNALTVCGSTASVKTLQAAAKAKGFALDPTSATDAYLQLLENLDDNVVVLKAAKELVKSQIPAIRCTGMELILKSDNKNVVKNILAALKDNDIQYRVTALDFAKQYAGEDIFNTVAGKFASYQTAAQADIVRWLGSNHIASQIDLVVNAINSNNEELAVAAIQAASKIGGDKALTALVGQLGKGGNVTSAAQKALLSFNGNIASGVLSALNSSDANVQVEALKLASSRRIYSTYSKVIELTKSSDANVKNAAYDALKGVVTPDKFNQVCDMLEASNGEVANKLQAAAKAAIQGQNADQQYNSIAARLNANKSKAALYYQLLAQAGNSQSIAKLQEEYKSGSAKDAAFKALLQVNNPEMIEVLYQLAKENPSSKDAVLGRYLTLVKGAGKSAIENYLLYSRALDLKPADKVQSSFVSALSSSKILPSLMLSAKYLDNAATNFAAATTVKDIVAKTADLQKGAEVKTILEKAKKVFKAEKDKGNADAGYAADEVDGILAKLDAQGGFKAVSELKNAGPFENFEMYFEWDGAADAVLNLRSMPIVKLEKAGISYVYSDKKVAPAGAWTLVYVKMLNDRLFVEVNGQPVATNAVVKNVPETKSALVKGAIEFAAADKGAQVNVRNFYLNALPETPISKLTDEEVKQGFEMLFDGRSLDKFHGNLDAYVPVDGNIYVTAKYGGTGNLYTKKNYSDFIFRFEFFFDVPAVNNGIGIRTGKDVTGVDAAYSGMEIQVLDHDDPAYQGHPFGYTGLRPYQNHGSVYGVITPEHVEFGPIKQWHTEEIKAVGDHITVTVDGKVILDGNIREACQGHNVAPDGGNTNPYTLDHKNHPGLFNKEGYISFCGHGAGVKFRNVRVLDLSKKKSKK